MTIADLSVASPGRPDQPAATAPDGPAEVAEVVDEPDGQLELESVVGLVKGAANLVHWSLKASYPEKPDIAVMTDGEARQLAGALLSMSSRHPGLRAVLERSDMATLAMVLSGYGGRIVGDISEVRRERKAAADGGGQREAGPGSGFSQGPGPGLHGIGHRPGFGAAGVPGTGG